MKRITTVFTALMIVATIWAQSPEAISYQAIIRDSNDQLVTNSSIGMQISILQGAEGGSATAVYVERQFPATNANGLATIEIGSSTATVITGIFSEIDWSAGNNFIKSEADPNGGSNYTISGTSQLLSVPYALYAKNVENKDDADADPFNEIQDISLSGNELTISHGSTVILSDSVKDDDSDPMNEIQALTISNDTIFLSNGGFVKIPVQGQGVDSWANSSAPGSLRLDDIQGRFTSVIPLGYGTLDNNEYGTQATSSIQKVTFDSQGNVCMAVTYTGSFKVGSNQYSSSIGILLAKYDLQGNVIWSHSLSSSDRAYVYGIETDADDNILIIGSTKGTLSIGSFSVTDKQFVAKYNTDGEFIWGLDAGAATRSKSLGTDDQNNAYFLSDGRITKCNSSGVIVESLSTPSNIYAAYDFQVSGDTLYVAGNWYSSSYEYPLLLKIPLDGSPTKSYTFNELTVPYSNGRCTSIAFDEENNIYTCGYNSGNNPYSFVSKHNNLLQKQWLHQENEESEYLSIIIQDNLVTGFNYNNDMYLSTEGYLDNLTKNGEKTPVLISYNTDGDLNDFTELKSFYGLGGFQVLEYNNQIYLFLNSYEGSFMNNGQKYEQGTYLLKL